MLLLIIAIGLTAYGLWQLVQAAVGVSGVDEGDSAKERFKSAARGVVYGALAVSAFTVVINGKSSSSQSKRQQEWTATVMKHTGGRWLIGLLGVGVAIVGIVLIVRGCEEDVREVLPDVLDELRRAQGDRDARPGRLDRAGHRSSAWWACCS